MGNVDYYYDYDSVFVFRFDQEYELIWRAAIDQT